MFKNAEANNYTNWRKRKRKKLAGFNHQKKYKKKKEFVKKNVEALCDLLKMFVLANVSLIESLAKIDVEDDTICILT